MTSSTVGPVWFVQAVGVGSAQGYRWLALSPADANLNMADEVMYGQLAGRDVVGLVSERTPSTVIGRRADGSFVLYVGGCIPARAPEGGDIQHRQIRAHVLGVAADESQVAPLLSVAAAALVGDLGASLPLDWVDGEPVVDRSVGAWPPAALPVSLSSVRVDPDESIGEPASAATDVAELLTGVDATGLRSFPPDHLLLVAGDQLPVESLAALRPWRAVSSLITSRRLFPPPPGADQKAQVGFNLGSKSSVVKGGVADLGSRRALVVALAAVCGGLLFALWLLRRLDWPG